MMSIGRMHKLKRMLSYAEQISSFENGESRHKLKQRMIVKKKKSFKFISYFSFSFTKNKQNIYWRLVFTATQGSNPLGTIEYTV